MNPVVVSPKRPTTPGHLRLTVGEFRLPGGSRSQAEALASAFRGELARRLADVSIERGFSRQRIVIEPFAMQPGERIEDTGRRLAQSIAQALVAPEGGSR